MKNIRCMEFIGLYLWAMARDMNRKQTVAFRTKTKNWKKCNAFMLLNHQRCVNFSYFTKVQIWEREKMTQKNSHLYFLVFSIGNIAKFQQKIWINKKERNCISFDSVIFQSPDHRFRLNVKVNIFSLKINTKKVGRYLDFRCNGASLYKIYLHWLISVPLSSNHFHFPVENSLSLNKKKNEWNKN